MFILIFNKYMYIYIYMEGMKSLGGGVLKVVCWVLHLNSNALSSSTIWAVKFWVHLPIILVIVGGGPPPQRIYVNESNMWGLLNQILVHLPTKQIPANVITHFFRSLKTQNPKFTPTSFLGGNIFYKQSSTTLLKTKNDLIPQIPPSRPPPFFWLTTTHN